MGKLARLVDGIKEKLALAGGETTTKKKPAVCGGGGGGYGKLDKTGSMRVEMRSRHAQMLIAKNLAAADSIAAAKKKKKSKKRFFAF
ncbi:hypothetical protein ACP4OV_024085 [Aristida adscensionis]